MKDFIDRHSDKITAVISGFDRMLFRGYLPIQNVDRDQERDHLSR
jgi:hypothetical protein